MNHQTSARFLILALGSAIGLALAVIGGQVELAILVAPAVILTVMAAAMHQWPEIDLTLEGPTQAVEGDRVDLVVSAYCRTSVPWLELSIELPPHVEPVEGIRHAHVTIPAGQRVSVKFPVELTQWGVARPGRVSAVARGSFGLFVSSKIHTPRLVVRVHPQDGNRKSVVVPSRLRARVGDHRSRRHGGGSDFAEVRPFRIGDSMRSVNWRVSARRQERWVTVRHPDQSGDLVFVLDTFADIGTEGNRLVQRAVRAAMSMVESNLDAHDRVGVLKVGRHIEWHRPRQGRLHKARLFDALLETQVEAGLRAPTLQQLPLHELDAGTMIVMLTGLADADMALIPIELRMRGLEVVVLECVADDHVIRAGSDDDAAQELAERIWRLQRLQRRQMLVANGVPVVPWQADQPLEQPVAAMARRDRALR